MEAEFYFSDNCTDSETQMEIKEKYITVIKNSNAFLIKKMCQSPQCNIDNVKVSMILELREFVKCFNRK
jgi:hypothetical protein